MDKPPISAWPGPFSSGMHRALLSFQLVLLLSLPGCALPRFSLPRPATTEDVEKSEARIKEEVNNWNQRLSKQWEIVAANKSAADAADLQLRADLADLRQRLALIEQRVHDANERSRTTSARSWGIASAVLLNILGLVLNTLWTAKIAKRRK